jgi:tRNA threonylcarbamoyladenosine biosynthesis protein TsaE
MTQIFHSNSSEETQRIAEEFAQTLQGGEVICLYGDLGYGKTTFMQGLAKGLGIEHRITSPTFIIMRRYEITKRPMVLDGERKLHMLYHVDLYRLEEEQAMVDLGLPDFMHDPESIVAIEWPEKLGKLRPKNRIDIRFDYVEENKREITMHYEKIETL